MDGQRVEQKRSPLADAFFAACAAGDVEALRGLLEREPGLASERNAVGTTGLHLAVAHPDAVRLLLSHGADPNARDAGDNALPLHFAAGGGHVESVRALLDAGSDAHGAGDLHELATIGWATVFAEPHREVVALLVERGARHHVFSAIALGDVELLRRVVAADPEAIRRRLSRFEQEQTALHYVVAPPDGLAGGTFRTGAHYRALEALIERGADLEATDARGRTPLAVAMLRGDRKAMRLLYAAGAQPPALPSASAAAPAPSLESLRASMGPITPMLGVPDMAATIAWYQSVGFVLAGSHGEPGRLDWASVQLGGAEIMLVPSSEPWRGATTALSLWIRTERIDELHAILERRQLERARAELAGEAVDGPEVQIHGDLHTAFYGQRELSLRDPNGVVLTFYQPLPAPVRSR